MQNNTEDLYAPALGEFGFAPEPDNRRYGPNGLCWRQAGEGGDGFYWIYGQKDLFTIKIHDFSFREDSFLEFHIPACLSVTYYESISGEELSLEEKQRILDVTVYINDHYAMELPQVRLAKIACMGGTKLKSCFRQYHGCTITEYIQQRRMSHGEQLLAQSDLPIGQVAQSVGYRSASRFAELFRVSTGLTPGAYRKRSKQQ